MSKVAELPAAWRAKAKAWREQGAEAAAKTAEGCAALLEEALEDDAREQLPGVGEREPAGSEEGGAAGEGQAGGEATA